MHLAILPGLLLALAGGAFGAASTSQAGATSAYMLPSYEIGYSVAAQATTTATVTTEVSPTAEVTATATLTTAASPQATQAPLPTVGPQGGGGGGGLRLNPFDWNYLTSAPPPDAPLGPFAWAFTILMLALFGASIYFYFFKRNEWKRTNSVLRRAAERWGSIGLWLSGLSLLFVLFRFVRLDFFNLRFWLYLALLATLALAGWFYYWYRTTYPQQIARYQKQQRARQYMPGAAKKGSARQTTPAAQATRGVSTTATSTTTPAGTTPAGPTTGNAPTSQSAPTAPNQVARKRRKRK